MTLPSEPVPSRILPDWLDDLPEDTRRALIARAGGRVVLAGATIYEQGTPADALYAVISGEVQLVFADRTRTVSRGECFGESEAISGSTFGATAIAASHTQLWMLDTQALDALLKTHSPLGLALARHLAQRLDHHSGPLPAAGRRVTTARAAPRQTRTLIAAGLVALVLAVGISAAGFWFWMTSRRVDALQVSAPPATRVTRAASEAPTKVGLVLAAAEKTVTATRLPETATHLVATGDTLGAIALMHATNPNTLRTINGLTSDIIRIGDPLKVPGGAVINVPTRTPRPPTATPRPTSAATVIPVLSVAQTNLSQPAVVTAPTALTPTAAPAAQTAPTPLPVLWQMPTWASVESANVPAGQKYWRLTKAIYFDEASAGGRINIFVATLDEEGKQLPDIPVKMAWGAGESTTRNTESKRDPFLLPYDLDIVASHDMASGSSFSPDRGERGGYSISVESLASDIVSGLGLPLRRHVAFLLVYQRATK